MGLSGLAPSQPLHGLHFVYFGGVSVLERGCEALASYYLQMGLLLAEKEASAQLERLLGNLFHFPGASQEFCSYSLVTVDSSTGVGLFTSENHSGEVAGGTCQALFLPSFIYLSLDRAGSLLGPQCPCWPMRDGPCGPRSFPAGGSLSALPLAHTPEGPNAEVPGVIQLS